MIGTCYIAEGRDSFCMVFSIMTSVLSKEVILWISALFLSGETSEKKK